MITTAEIGAITRPEARTLAEDETAAMVALLADLSPDEWARPTDCPVWDVRAMAGHVLGMTERLHRPASDGRDVAGRAGSSRQAARSSTASRLTRSR